MRLLLATANPHKVGEFERLLVAHPVEPLPAGVALPPEDGDSFAANALVKARAAAEALGRATIADDSGISAAALGGDPGIRSARFAGEGASDAANLAKLIALVAPGSALTYTCALAYVDPGSGEERVFEERCDGAMAPAPAGEGGFGYDPIFVPREGDGRTMAQLAEEEKDRISHRGRAARALEAWLSGRPAATEG